tara:strand:+ start:624 stop:1436 length:813 start_codon:yes stop_codon:yes gene_type:complete
MISKKNIKFFEKEGYILSRKSIGSKDILRLKKSIFVALEKILKSKKIKKKINEKNVNEQMILLRKKNPELFARFFDTVQTLTGIYLAISNNKVLNIISRLIRANIHEITLTDVGIRLDVPHDTRNALGWHQDSSYYRQNNLGKNGVILWAPLFKIEKDMGTLQWLRFSHKLGSLNISKKKKKSAFASSKREIDSKYIRKFKEILENNVSVGDVLLMNPDLVHRSGYNSNKEKVRVTMLARFHNMITNDFNPGYNIYKYSDKRFNSEVHGF